MKTINAIKMEHDEYIIKLETAKTLLHTCVPDPDSLTMERIYTAIDIAINFMDYPDKNSYRLSDDESKILLNSTDEEYRKRFLSADRYESRNGSRYEF